MGKGHKSRPFSVSRDEYFANHELAFGTPEQGSFDNLSVHGASETPVEKEPVDEMISDTDTSLLGDGDEHE